MPIDGATTRFVGIDFSDLPWSEAVARVAAASCAPVFATVVTPNVDHVVRLEQLGTSLIGNQYRAASEDADFCFCDSRVLQRLARLRGTRLSLVPGSDLTTELFAHHISSICRIAIIGGDADMLENLKARHPDLQVVQHIPPMGMVDDHVAMDEAAHFIAKSNANYTFIAVGSPQGEILAARARALGASRGVALSVGASIEFITGRQTRAPWLLQKLGLEWAYRLATNPKRLWRRYLVDGPRIFAIVMRSPAR